MKRWHLAVLIALVLLLSVGMWFLIPSDYAIKTRIAETANFIIHYGSIVVIWLARAAITLIIGGWILLGAGLIGVVFRGIFMTYVDYRWTVPNTPISKGMHLIIAFTTSIVVWFIWLLTIAPLLEQPWSFISGWHDHEYNWGPILWGLYAVGAYWIGYNIGKYDEDMDNLANFLFKGPFSFMRKKFPFKEERMRLRGSEPRRLTNW
ncbi:MAG: hypothetical protein ACOZAO_05195 [Patescibacteria group bacterium]